MGKTKPDVTYMLDQMHELYRDFPVTELNYETPWQCLMSVMLSAQTTDIQVNKATVKFYDKIKSPQDILDRGEEALGEGIRILGLWRSKQHNVFATAGMLVRDKSNEGNEIPVILNAANRNLDIQKTGVKQGNKVSGPNRSLDSSVVPPSEGHMIFGNSQEVYARHGYHIPDTIDDMMKLPGVGIKTAKVVLYVLYRQRRVAVDTHVHRVMNRLGVIQTKTPDQSSKLLEDIIPDEYKDIAHHSIIYFGRYLCKAKKPECERCPLYDVCTWEGKKRK